MAEPRAEIRTSPPGYYDHGSFALAVRFPQQAHWHLVRPSYIGMAVGKGSDLEAHIDREWAPLAGERDTEVQQRIAAAEAIAERMLTRLLPEPDRADIETLLAALRGEEPAPARAPKGRAA